MLPYDIPLLLKKEKKIVLGLDRISKVLKYFGNPQHKIDSCTVAGTVGKGQIATEIAYNLSDLGKIGIYTSPHLISITERIKIVEKYKETEISIDQLSWLSKEVFDVERRLGVELTYFEHATVVAYLWFVENKVDFLSLEIGLGGRLDAVSTAKSKIGIISRIDIDHEDFLGSDVKQIAKEKALAVPPESRRITIHKAGEPQFEGIQEVSKGEIINDFKYSIDHIEQANIVHKVIKFTLFEPRYAKDGIKVTFFGPAGFLENAILSSFSSYIIAKEIFGTEKSSLSHDIKHIKGRIELKNNIIYDGGHNIISAKNLFDTLPDTRLTFIVAFMKDKRWREFLKILKPKIKFLYITQADEERGEEPAIIKSFTDSEGVNSAIVKKEELIKLLDELTTTSELVCVTGTFYLYKFFSEIK